MEIQDFIIDYIDSRGTSISDIDMQNSNLLEEGILDSFGMITLLMEIESKYNVKITPIDMLDDNNKTINGLSKLIKSKIV